MRKSIVDPATTRTEQRSEQEWLDLEQVAKVEVTSEIRTSRSNLL